MARGPWTPFCLEDHIPSPFYFRMSQLAVVCEIWRDLDEERVLDTRNLDDMAQIMTEVMKSAGRFKRVRWYVSPMHCPSPECGLQMYCAPESDTWNNRKNDYEDPRFVSAWGNAIDYYHLNTLIMKKNFPIGLACIMRRFLEPPRREIEWNQDDRQYYTATTTFELRVMWQSTCGEKTDVKTYYCKHLFDCKMLMKRQLVRPGWVHFRLEQWECQWHDNNEWSWEPCEYL